MQEEEVIRLYEDMKADEIERLRGEVASLKAAAEKGTEYVLAQINQDLRAEVEKLRNKSKWGSHNILNKIKALHAETDLRRKAEAERDAAVAVLTEVGTFLDHCWRDVQMNDFSFEWLERMIAAIDAARGEK